MYFRPELFEEHPQEVYEQALGESVQHWLDSTGDLDDFIFYDEPDWAVSER